MTRSSRGSRGRGPSEIIVESGRVGVPPFFFLDPFSLGFFIFSPLSFSALYGRGGERAELQESGDGGERWERVGVGVRSRQDRVRGQRERCALSSRPTPQPPPSPPLPPHARVMSSFLLFLNLPSDCSLCGIPNFIYPEYWPRGRDRARRLFFLLCVFGRVNESWRRGYLFSFSSSFLFSQKCCYKGGGKRTAHASPGAAMA